MPLTQMGHLNLRWGVCGFNSALYALYNNSPGIAHGDLSHVATNDVVFLNMIADYLEELQNTGAAALVQSIEAFTSSFPGYAGFSVQTYVERIRFLGTIGADRAVGDFSIAMPPAAVVDFLKRRCAFNNARVVPHGYAAQAEEIVGLNDPTGQLVMHNGLAHYVYRRGVQIHSWGQIWASIAAVGAIDPSTAGWVPCVRIALH
ncbi:MAG: hypothetical protein AAF334_09880 [Pseudomonadota bacterium]